MRVFQFPIARLSRFLTMSVARWYSVAIKIFKLNMYNLAKQKADIS